MKYLRSTTWLALICFFNLPVYSASLQQIEEQYAQAMQAAHGPKGSYTSEEMRAFNLTFFQLNNIDTIPEGTPILMPGAKPRYIFQMLELYNTDEWRAPAKKAQPAPEDDLFFTLDVNYSIRTENAKGQMIRLSPGSLSDGQVVKIEGVRDEDISYNSDGSINEFETLSNFQTRKNITARPYGNKGSTEIFFPVSVYTASGEEIKFESTPEIALLHAANKGVVTSVPETQLQTQFLMSVSKRNRIHYVDYTTVSSGEDDCKNPFLSFDLPTYFKDYSMLPTTQCTEDIKSNGAYCLYPNASTFQSYARQGRSGRNQCYGMINKQSCNTDFWKGMNLKQRINHTIEKSNPILKEFDINPFVAPCLTSKETTFESSTIRTRVACTLKSGTPTALGAFQINYPTLKDMVQRGLFNLSSSENNKTPIHVIEKLKPFLRKHLTADSFALLTDPGMSVRSRSKSSQVGTLAQELYNLMTISFDLQLAMFGTVLKAKDYSFGAYYGAADSDSANAKYARYVASCLDCMHERSANKDHKIHACVALSKGKSLATMDDGYESMAANIERFQSKYCEEDYDCQNGTCKR